MGNPLQDKERSDVETFENTHIFGEKQGTWNWENKKGKVAFFEQ